MGKNLRHMWDNIKYISIHVMGVQKGEERKEQKNISKNNFGEKIPPQI